MYIPEFWAGVITAIGVEFAILIIVASLWGGESDD